jgi:hypothetical protein
LDSKIYPGQDTIGFNDCVEHILKMDAYTYSELKKYDDDMQINLFVMLNDIASDDELRELENSGCTIRSQVGSIITIESSASNIKKILRYDFVKFIQLSHPLNIQKEEK